MAIDDNALPYTLLSPNRYARIMQINPAHFNGLLSATIMPVRSNSCSDIWFRYDWQDYDSVSWESLVMQIGEAERNTKAFLRYSPAPDWEIDVRPWAKYHRRDVPGFGVDNKGEHLSVATSWDYLIYPGVRAVSSIATSVVVAYSDPDLDGYNELATISAPTSLTDVNEIKVYIAGKAGAREWEVRPVKSKTISGGVITVTFNSWVLVNPDLRSRPTNQESPSGLDLLSSTSYVTTLDIYREYTDTSATSSEIFWASNCALCGGSGCAVCQLSTETGCGRIVSTKPGFMQPQPATFADGSWSTSNWPTTVTDPTEVKLKYYAGFLSQKYLQGMAYDPLDDNLAQAIAWLATARLERPYCSCGTASSLAARLMMDMAFSESGTFKNLSQEELENPFGTRLGEIWAYKVLKKIKGKNLGGYAA